ncbi:MAG TPA: hypothetical protein VGN16_04005 [Acidobacteriaceae bacterium]|jgi:hypothetical protein
MSITRPQTLSEHEMELILERLANSGAKITMTDPRVTSMQTWVLSSIGTALIALVGWGVISINELNTTMTRVVTSNEYRDITVAELKLRVGDLERHRP